MNKPLVASQHGPSCRRGGGIPLPLLVIVVGLGIKVGIGSCTGTQPASRSGGRIGTATEGKVAAQGRAIAGIGRKGSYARKTSRARVLLDDSAPEGVDGRDPAERAV